MELDERLISDTIDLAARLPRVVDPELERMAARLEEAASQLRFGDEALAAELVALVVDQLADRVAVQ